MPCGCHPGAKAPSNETSRSGPFTQCIFCAQKHADEALAAMNEFTYELENRSFVHGSIRAVVNHTFRAWPDIAATARKAALQWQTADFRSARATIMEAIKAIDGEIRRQNPDIDAKITGAAHADQ